MSSMACGNCRQLIIFTGCHSGRTHCPDCGWEIPDKDKEYPECDYCAKTFKAKEGTPLCPPCSDRELALTTMKKLLKEMETLSESGLCSTDYDKWWLSLWYDEREEFYKAYERSKEMM